jgi:hypothetical protein
LLRIAQRGSLAEKPAPTATQHAARGAAAAAGALATAAGAVALARALR